MYFIRKLLILGLGRERYFLFSRFLRGLAKPIIAIGYQKYLPVLKEIVRPGDLCFDIGANLGYTTDLVVKLGGKSLAVEPVRWCYDYLLRSYGKKSSVLVVHAAVGKRSGRAKIYVCDEANAISTLSEDWASSGRYAASFSWNRAEDVSVVTLDNLIDQYGQPRFINIDVEGFEYEVLQGLTKRVDYLAFEYTPEMSKRAVSCVRLLVRRFSIRLNLLHHKQNSFVSPTWLPPKQFLSLLSENTDSVGDIFVKLE